MNDSPVGLLAWIVEKFYFSADCGGDLDKSFSKDELLTNVALYWFTQRAPSSFRIYYEASSTGDFQALLKAYCPVRAFPFTGCLELAPNDVSMHLTHSFACDLPGMMILHASLPHFESRCSQKQA